MTETPNYRLQKFDPSEYFDVEHTNGNMDRIDTALSDLEQDKAKRPESVTAGHLATLDDQGDLLDSGKGLDDLVPVERRVNGKPLSADVELMAEDVAADPEGTAAQVQASVLHQLEGISARLVRIEDMFINGVTKNPWSVEFADLDGLAVAGVWNVPMQRVEF